MDAYEKHVFGSEDGILHITGLDRQIGIHRFFRPYLQDERRYCDPES